MRRPPRRGIPWRWRAPCDGPSRPGARRTSPAACPNARWRCRPRRSKECWIRSATAARRAALQMLDAVRGGATLQGARDGALANLVERDRRLAYELAAGVLRRRGQLDRMLELATANPRLHDVLRLGAYQLRALARVPAYAAVSTSVELAREVAGEKAARYVNQALRRLARDALKDSLTVAGCGTRDAVETHPLWLVKRWKVQFGRSETERLMDWNDARAPLTLQPARWDATTLRARLTKAGFGVREAPFGAGVVVETGRSEEHTSELQSLAYLVCRLLLEKKKQC